MNFNVFIFFIIGGIYAKTQLTLSINQIVAGEKKSYSISYPEQLPKLKVFSKDKLNLKLSIKADDGSSIVPEQVVLALSSKSTTTYPLTKLGSIYTLDLDAKNLPETSDYKVTLYVAGKKADPLAYSLGSISVSNEIIPIESDYRVKREISHKFKEDVLPPNPLLPNAFVIATLSPWVFLIGSWFAIGANVRNWTRSVPSIVFGTLFLIGLASSLLLFYSYWLKLTLFQLFGYGSPIWFVTAILGRFALVDRAQLRTSVKSA